MEIRRGELLLALIHHLNGEEERWLHASDCIVSHFEWKIWEMWGEGGEGCLMTCVLSVLCICDTADVCVCVFV